MKYLDDFVEHFLSKLEEARQTSKTPDGVVRVTEQEIRAAIPAFQFFQRVTTSFEQWIVAQYINFLDEKLGREVP